jgi:hypothetical protein
MSKYVIAGILALCIFAGAVCAKSSVNDLQGGILADRINAIAEVADY